MKTSGFTNCPIIDILKQANADSPAPELYREHSISNATFYK
jgi:putative transposase